MPSHYGDKIGMKKKNGMKKKTTTKTTTKKRKSLAVGLTEKQKKLPKKLQEAILKKQRSKK